MDTTDFVFNEAMRFADKYKNVESRIFREMIGSIPGTDMSIGDWVKQARKNNMSLMQYARKLTGMSSKALAKDLAIRFNVVVSETAKDVDEYLKLVKQKFPSFEIPRTKTQMFNFLRNFQPRTLRLLEKMNQNIMMPLSNIVPRYNQAFGDLINNAILRVSNGMSVGDAVKESVKKLTKDNINYIQYAGGRKIKASSYVEMTTRTEMLNLHRDTQLERMREYNLNLVQISTHFDCSEMCLPWQGGVYTTGGVPSPKYEDINIAIAGGLYHPNCRHMQFPFVEGISKVSEPVKVSDARKQRVVRERFRANKRVIERSQNQLQTSKFLDKRSIDTAKNRLAKARAENKLLQDTQPFLQAPSERKLPSNVFKELTFDQRNNFDDIMGQQYFIPEDR